MTSPGAWGDSPETTWTDAAGNRRLYDPDLDDNYPGTWNDREREEYPSEAQKWPQEQEAEEPNLYGSGWGRPDQASRQQQLAMEHLMGRDRQGAEKSPFDTGIGRGSVVKNYPGKKKVRKVRRMFQTHSHKIQW